MKSDEGVGLANVRERLRILYGDKAELVIEAPQGGGALASIRVPFSMMEKH
jgi:sensor histidine kinase YesM